VTGLACLDREFARVRDSCLFVHIAGTLSERQIFGNDFRDLRVREGA
jgi:hypothetical protein